MKQILTSQRLHKSKLTLPLVLLLFICQFFASCISAHTQYPQSSHHFNVMTCHFHDINSLNIELGHTNVDLNGTDHEHDNHSHTSCHPPVEITFITALPKNKGIALPLSDYQAYRFAPPIRPPLNMLSA